MKIKLSRLAFFLVAILWGSSFAFQKELFSFIGPSSMTFYNFLPAAIVFIFLSLTLGKSIFYRWREGLVLGVMLTFLELFQTYALYNTSASNSAFISNLGMLLIPFLGFLIFKHKIRNVDIIAILISVIGMYFLVGGVYSLNKGDVLCVVTALFIGLYFLYSEYFQGEKKSDLITLCAQQFFIVTILSLISSFIFSEALFVEKIHIFTLSWQVFVFNIFPFVLIQWASRYSDDMTATMYDGVLEPLVGGLVAWIIFKEVLSSFNIFGAIIMLFAFGLSIVWGRKIKLK
jgi:drug/metabolite transporter (DMT)-like permease